MLLIFEEWLFDQQYRDDLIGDLARVLSMQNIDREPSRRKSDEHKNWVEIVIAIAEPRYVAVFNEAWQEFLLAKQSAEGTLN